MNSRDKIIQNIKKHSPTKIKRETFKLQPTTYENPLETFIQNLKQAGGDITQKPSSIVIKAEFAVAENAAVYINHPKDEDRRIYSFYEEITILLDKNSILNNMHEAYERVKIDEFGIFLSGPSKTADIEQSLVIGAHGAKRLTVLFK
jgi:L-lactate utilization protein LutC